MGHDYTQTHIVDGVCRVCGGEVIRELHYAGRGVHACERLKPEQRSPYNTTISYGPRHCSGCGILYHFLKERA